MRHILLACVLFCCTLSDESAAQTIHEERTVQKHVYIDDDDQRSLADLRFNVEATNQQNLRITVSAIGPDVEPIAGFRGVSGGNRYTAEELGLILDGHNQAQIVTRFDNGLIANGRILEGKFGTLAERRLLPNGRIDFLGQTELAYPLELIVDPQTKSSGPRTTMIVIAGQARLRCRYSIVNGKVENLKVQSLGHDNFLAQAAANKPLPGRRYRLTASQDVTPPVSEEAWNQRDNEGKWVLLTEAIQKEPASIANWVNFLVQKKETVLLEWMAIYMPDAFKSHGVGEALIKLAAPQWIRVAAWHNNGFSSVGHGVQQANKDLLYTTPSEVEHWLEKHKELLDNWQTLSAVLSVLKKDKHDPKDSSSFLPPLQPKTVFATLFHTGELVDFGTNAMAKPDVVYTHQMIRAISGIAVGGRRTPDLLKAVRRHTAHAEQDVRIAALLAHTYLLPKSPGTERFDDFVGMIDDDSEPQKIREAAMMALSYHKHPSVLLKMHQVAANPAHAAWNAAVSRLSGVGRMWSAGLLRQQLDAAELTTSQQRLLADTLERLDTRSEAHRIVGSSEISTGIVQAVFAEKTGDSNARYILDEVLKRANIMKDKKRTHLKNRLDFAKLMKIWLPCDQQEFAARVAEVRATVRD